MKTKWPAIGLACVLLASGSLLANRVSATPDPTTPAVRVTAKITPESVRITARSTAPFTYSTSRPSDRLIVIDLPGAVAAEASHSQTLSRANVGSYPGSLHEGIHQRTPPGSFALWSGAASV